MELAGLYRDVVERSPNGIWVVDLEDRTVYANPAMEQLAGVGPGGLAERTVTDLLDAAGRTQYAEHLLRRKADGAEADAVEVRLQRPDGTVLWCLVRERAAHDEDGTPSGWVITYTDITDRRAVGAELAASQRLMAEAQSIARVGSWEMDVATGHMLGSDQLDEMYGLDGSDGPWTPGRFLTLVHPADRGELAAGLAALVEHGTPLDQTARVEVDGEYQWTRGRGVAVRDEHGTITALRGTLQDVTEAIRAQGALRAQVATNDVMYIVSSAANQAETLQDLLDLVPVTQMPPDWEGAQAFVVTDDGVSPWPADSTGPRVVLTAPLARQVAACGQRCWDETGALIGFPLTLGGDVLAVVVLEASAPVVDTTLVEGLVDHVAEQMSRVAWREQVVADLAEARDAAMEASRMKSDFLATMSHEIRTPLNGVIGLNDLLLRTRLDSDQQRLATGVQVASRALLGVINDILDFSKIEAGRLELEVIDFEVRPVFDQVAGVLGEAARGKGVELVLSCAPDVPRVLAGDPTRLAQVLTNLVSNAVKFTAEGEVVVRATSVPGRTPDGAAVHRLHVSVTDTGIGVDPERATGLFDPFTQADASTTRTFGGTGLGLAISREIVTAHGGAIGFRARETGGSEFFFNVLLGEARTTLPAGADDAARDLLGGLRMLVVDDHDHNRLIVGEQLRWWDVEPDGAVDADGAEEAVHRAREEGRPYAAVLLDMAMPGRDGLALARSLRDDPANADVRLLMLTSVTHLTTTEVQAAGVDDLLVKPVLSDVLRSALTSQLGAEGTATRSSATRADRPGAGRRVLVVEDNPVNQMVAAGLLEHLGYGHRTVDDGQAAVLAAETERWDAILMDVQMPVLDGYGATRRIRDAEEMGGRPRCPIIAMTAAAVEGERERCAEAGMDDYLTKPVDPASLSAALETWLGPAAQQARADLASGRAGLAPSGTPAGSSSAPGPLSSPESPTPHGGTLMDTSTPQTALEEMNGPTVAELATRPELAGLDLPRLETLRDLDPGSTAYLERAIGNFTRNSLEVVDLLRAATAEGDVVGLRQHAHKLAGGALNLGAREAGVALQTIELLADTGTTHGAAPLIDTAEQALVQARAALDAYAATFSTGG
ncbi:response regulator [Nocardioides bruguierae]|uniref:response regulator n=1 Tax=Nocardioides bruguierae TaxID=2945102 RepID=UPI0020220945|nr:response regulator [Nocardioides bruguierae]MCL8024635.1 response regulator [Nocardioides bruguierae]